MNVTRKKVPSKLLKEKIKEPLKKVTNGVVDTGSTLLNLAISCNKYPKGGIPYGTLVEIAGPSQSGKTVLLSQMAGNVIRQGINAMYADPEARLDTKFAKLFGFDVTDVEYFRPDTVTELFEKYREQLKDNRISLFADSLAALSTNVEMDNGDKMGMRRAKEFSEQLRITCREIANKKSVVIGSNQLRQSGSQFGSKYVTPGGEAIGFYSSVRLWLKAPVKIAKSVTVKGKKITRPIGITSNVTVTKTVDVPYRSVPLYIIFDYGIDDIRANLQYVKDMNKHSVYMLNGKQLHNSMETAIKIIEDDNLEQTLQSEVIELYHYIENKFSTKRKIKYETK